MGACRVGTGLVVGTAYRRGSYSSRAWAVRPGGELVELSGVGPQRYPGAAAWGITADDDVLGLALTDRGYGIARWSLDAPDQPAFVAPVPRGYFIRQLFTTPDGGLAAAGSEEDEGQTNVAWWWDADGKIHQLVGPDGSEDVSLFAFSGRYAMGIVGDRYASAVQWDLLAGTSRWLPEEPSFETMAVAPDGVAAVRMISPERAAVLRGDVLEELPQLEGSTGAALPGAITADHVVAGTTYDADRSSQQPVVWRCD